MSAPAPTVAAEHSWPLWRRWLLNFGTLYLGLYFVLGGQGLLPAAAKAIFAGPLHRLLFGSELLVSGSLGSGDTSLDWAWTLVLLLASLLLGTLWTLWPKGHLLLAPERQARGLLGALRVFLVAWLLTYGLIKFSFGQFGLLPPGQLTATYAESSPMGLLWRFMAASPGYQWVAGVAEVLPALLLLHRRTVTVGALIAAVTLTNVLALNLFYDVPVKLFSAHLLLTALVIALADARRLWAFARGGTVDAVVERPSKPAARWGAWIVTGLCLVAVAWQAGQGVQRWRADQQTTQITREPLKTRGFHWVNETPYNR